MTFFLWVCVWVYRWLCGSVSMCGSSVWVPVWVCKWLCGSGFLSGCVGLGVGV
mgnify:CR=1 FL=1